MITLTKANGGVFNSIKWLIAAMPAKSKQRSAKDTHYNTDLNYIKRVTLGNEIFYMASDGRRLHAVNVEMLGDLLTADYYSVAACTAQVITLADPGHSTDIHWPALPSDLFDHHCYLTTAEADSHLTVEHLTYWLNRGDLAGGTDRTTWNHSMIETALGAVADGWDLGWNRGQRSEGNRALLLVGRCGSITRAHMALIMPILLPDTLPIRTINHMHGDAIAYID
mgnify:FL=1